MSNSGSLPLMASSEKRNHTVIPGALHDVELYVSDLNRSIASWSWFLESLGYELYQSWDKGRSWRLGDTYIVFVQTEPRFLDVPYHRCRVGLNHLAFHARSREHIDEARGHPSNTQQSHPRQSTSHSVGGCGPAGSPILKCSKSRCQRIRPICKN